MALLAGILSDLGYRTACLGQAAVRLIPDPPALQQFEFFDNGLYFWGNAPQSGCGDFGSFGTLTTVGYRGPRVSPLPAVTSSITSWNHALVRGCNVPVFGGVARDDLQAYYHEAAGGVYRVFIGLSNNPPRVKVGGATYPDYPGALMVRNGRLYVAHGSTSLMSSPSGSLGRFYIGFYPLPDVGPLTALTIVSHGAAQPDLQPGPIKRMTTLVIQKVNPFTGLPMAAEVGLALGRNGVLMRFDLDTSSLFNDPNPVVLAANVTDFAVRRETYRPPGSVFPVDEDVIYAATSSDPASPCGTDSQVVTVSPYTGAQAAVWTGVNGHRITDLAADREYLFANTYAVSFPGGLGCEQGQAVIRSKRRPANRVNPGTGIDPDWSAIELNGGVNLRSDDSWLYFVRSNAIWRVANNAPPIRFDLAALGLEAVQVIQDLNNSIRLIEGKATVVRGYARLAENTLPQTNWFPNAALRGFVNGVELPGSPLAATRQARVTASGDWANLRTNLDRGFLFDLPEDWVRRGTLTLRMTVNPAQAFYESGGDPMANNSVEATVNVVAVHQPCLIFSTVWFNGPDYWPWENQGGFWRIIARARSILPVRGFDVRYSNARIVDESVCAGYCIGFLPVGCLVPCLDPFDLTTNDGWSEALDELSCFSGFTRPRDYCPQTHFVGAIHPSVRNPAWGGLGLRPGNHLLTIMTPGPSSGINAFGGGVTLAHELAHNLGAQHVDQTLSQIPGGCGGGQPAKAAPYPHDECTIGPTSFLFPDTVVGFDTLSDTVIPPFMAADLMSYANQTWISRELYDALIDALGPVGAGGGLAPAAPPSPPSPPPGPFLVVHGWANFSRRQVTLKAAYTLPDDIANPAAVVESLAAARRPPAHPYVVRVLDAAGAVLQSAPLDLIVPEDGNGQGGAFRQFLQKPATAAAVQIVANGAVLAEARASGHPPVILGVQATPNAANGTLTVNVSSADADGGPLYLTVQFSEDGIRWQPIKVNTLQTSFTVDTTHLPGGNACRVRVIVSDGFHSAVAITTPFSLPKHAPEVFISGVQPGERVPSGRTVGLEGHAIDAEDETIPENGLSWALAGNDPRTGLGSTFRLTGLPPGRHTVTVTGRDADGQEATATVAFEVLPLAVPDGAAPTLDGDPNDAAYADAPAVGLPGGGTVRLLHAGGYLFASVTGLPTSSGDVPGSFALRVEADGAGSSATAPQDFALTIVEDGSALQWEGSATGFAIAAAPSPDVKVVMTRGAEAWNVEFRIPDARLGGWNHAARVELANSWSRTRTSPLGITFVEHLLNRWPAAAEDAAPATWAPAWLGLPPAPLNQAPVARVPAHVVLAISSPQSVSLHGSGSFDPDGDALTFEWTQVSGPMVSLRDPTSATPSFVTEAIAGNVTRRFRLIVSDGQAASAPAEVTVTLLEATAPSSAGPSAVAEVQADGSVTAQLLWPGEPGVPVVVQASSNLVNWANVGTATINDLRILAYRDAQARQHPHRFYRLAAAPEAPPCAPAPDQLVAWWRAEEDGLDAAGSNHGTLMKGLTFAPGRVGRALTFAGGHQELLVPPSASLDVSTAAGFTIEGWINPADAVTAFPLVAWGDTIASGTHLWINLGYLGEGGPGALYAAPRFGDASFFASAPGLIVPNTWQHVAMTFDRASGVARLYHNGSQVALKNAGTSPVQTTLPLHLGYWVNGPAYRGLLDEFALYRRALGSNEIRAIHQAGASGKCPAICGPMALPLIEEFETGGAPNYALSQLLTAPGPTLQPAGPGSTGRFLRLIQDGINSQNNAIAFPMTASGGWDGLVAQFDFRLVSGDAPADGLAFLYLPTSIYGTNGPGFTTPIAIEEPNLPGVFAVGFDVHPRTEPRNDISVHWNGTERTNVTLLDAQVNLTAGVFHRAFIVQRAVPGGAIVSVAIVRDVQGAPSNVVAPVRDLFIPGLSPYPGRVQFGARSGALDMSVDLDNVRVQHLPTCQSGP